MAKKELRRIKVNFDVEQLELINDLLVQRSGIFPSLLRSRSLLILPLLTVTVGRRIKYSR